MIKIPPGRLVIIIALIVSLIPLLIFVYAAQFVRYLADDFCFGPTVSLWNMIRGDGFPPTATVLDYLIHLARNNGSTVYCLLFLAIFGVGLWLVFREIFHNYVGALLGTSLVLGAILVCGTNVIQSVYWQAGMVENLVPLISITFLVWLLIQRTVPPLPSIILCFVVAFLGGADSNAFSVGQLALLGLFWLAFRNRPTLNIRLFASMVAAALAIGAILLIPGITSRISSGASLPLVIAEPSVVSRLIHGFIRGVKDPLIYTFAYRPFIFLAVLILPFTAAQMPSANSLVNQLATDLAGSPRKRIGAALGAVGLPTAALISCMIMWGAGYVTQGRLPTRTWIDGQFFLLAATAAASFVVGLIAKATFPAQIEKLSHYRPAVFGVVGIVLMLAIGTETIRAKDVVNTLQPLASSLMPETHNFRPVWSRFQYWPHLAWPMWIRHG